MKPKKVIYLDYAATTPVLKESVKATKPYQTEVFGNPSSLHTMGVRSKKGMEEARKTFSKLINCRPEEIVFTSGGTESVNLAILGVGKKALRNTANGKPHFITTKIEHHAVLECFRELEVMGAKVTYLDVDSEGFVKVESLEKALSPQTVLVSIMYANNEIGTVQNILGLSKAIHSFNIKRKGLNTNRVIFHTDACQAPGFLDLNVNRLGVDLLSISASKFYGPKGNGLLFVRQEFKTKLEPLIYGGGQEMGLRSGTENVSGLVGAAKAFELTLKNSTKEISRIRDLQKYFVKNVLKLKDVKLNGPDIFAHEAQAKSHKLISRLPNNINLSVKGVEGEALMLYLDAKGICISTGSACSTGSTERSHVIKSIGVTAEEWSKGTIRITLGKFTTKKELDITLQALKESISMLRKVSNI